MPRPRPVTGRAFLAPPQRFRGIPNTFSSGGNGRLMERGWQAICLCTCSATHFVTNTHGPTRAFATGGLRYWRDGRDVPDVMLGLFDYPQGFNLSLRVNFV